MSNPIEQMPSINVFSGIFVKSAVRSVFSSLLKIAWCPWGNPTGVWSHGYTHADVRVYAADDILTARGLYYKAALLVGFKVTPVQVDCTFVDLQWDQTTLNPTSYSAQHEIPLCDTGPRYGWYYYSLAILSIHISSQIAGVRRWEMEWDIPCCCPVTNWIGCFHDSFNTMTVRFNLWNIFVFPPPLC